MMEYGPIRDIREFTGTVSPMYRYLVAPKVSGQLIQINHRIGDRVKSGEIIAVIDAEEYQQALLEAQAELRISEASLAEARSDLNLAESDYERTNSLVEKGFISQTELESAAAALENARAKVSLVAAQIEQKEAALRLAEIKLGYTELKADKSGFIAERFYDEGSLINSNTPVVAIVGIEIVIIKSNLIEKLYGRIKLGHKAEITTDAYPEKIFPGEVTGIAPVLDENTRMAEMEIEVENLAHYLKPGMFCKVALVLSEKDSTQVVMNRILVKQEDQTGVFIVEEPGPLARFQPVELGIITEDFSEIIEPRITQPIITLGQYQLKDGSRILLPEAIEQKAGE
jgi:RND family efflux transporter MFP subunit